jgi:hypothetical protein
LVQKRKIMREKQMEKQLLPILDILDVKGTYRIHVLINDNFSWHVIINIKKGETKINNLLFYIYEEATAITNVYANYSLEKIFLYRFFQHSQNYLSFYCTVNISVF